jgi:hypothetical protein
MSISARQQRIKDRNLPLPVFPDQTSKTPSGDKVLHLELGEYDLGFEIVTEGYTHKGRMFDRIRATIIVPMGLHPAFHEEAIRQFKCFGENCLRIAEIALNDYLDRNCVPAPTADGKLAVDMEVRLPSPDKSVAPSTSEPALLIKPVAPEAGAK